MTDVVRIFPTLGYKDARRALNWLHEAFGLEIGAVYPAEGATVDHAEMFYGNGGIMLGSMPDTASLRQAERDNPSPGSIYVIVDQSEIEAHFARARHAGAAIVMDLHDTEHGSRKYIAQDFEGHLWSFDTYVPVRPT